MSEAPNSVPPGGTFPFEQTLRLAEKLSQSPLDAAVVRSVAAELRAISQPAVASETSAAPAAEGRQDEVKIAALLKRLRDPRVFLNDLHSLCRAPSDERALWRQAPEAYPLAAEKLLELGDPILAYNITVEGRDKTAGRPDDLRLRQLQGLALARSGATRLAHKELTDLHDDGYRDSETLGLLASAHKDLALQAAGRQDRDHHFRRALKLYHDAWKLHGDPGTGINAATVALLLTERKLATELCGEIGATCLQQLSEPDAPGADRYRMLANLGQMALILGQTDRAREWYAQAGELGKGLFGKLAATRRDAYLLTDFLGLDRRLLADCLCIPNVVVFVGHMIDRPDRAVPRFPPLLERAVGGAIRDRLTQLNGHIGYSSAACGSDILFLEALQDARGQGSESHVVLP